MSNRSLPSTSEPSVFVGEWRRRESNPRTVPNRFRSLLLEVESGCIEFQGCLNKQGYGRFGYGKTVVLAHRYAWELEREPVPVGSCVLHRCDNPACCNVDHLFLGSRADNNRDMWAKGRGRIAYRTGEHSNNAKLTAAQAAEIRRRYVPKVVTLAMLAAEFDIDMSTVSQIVRGVTWKDAA